MGCELLGPRHAAIRGWAARGGNAVRFLGPEPALEVSRRDLQKRLVFWLLNQHGAQWRHLGYTESQAQSFISWCSMGTRAKFLTFNRIQSKVVIDLLMVITP